MSKYTLINYDFKTLHISGITLFKGGWSSDYKGRDKDLGEGYTNQIKGHPEIDKVINHAQKPQQQLLKLITDNNKKITLDPEVKESLL